MVNFVNRQKSTVHRKLEMGIKEVLSEFTLEQTKENKACSPIKLAVDR